MIQPTNRRSILIVAAAIAVAVLAVLLATQLREPSAAEDTASPTVMNVNTGTAGDVPRRSTDDPLVLGDDTAPVTMVVFGDFTCEYCVHFATQLQPKIIDEYVKPGRLRIEWRDAPTSGPAARLAARAGRAAAGQDRFWPMHDAIMHAQAANHAQLTADALVRLAGDSGVDDLEKFRDEMTGADFDAEIDSDLTLAQRLFIPPSPAYWIDGSPLLGGYPLWAFENAIDGKLKLGAP
ncbi:DsbA family protein [Gordonia zhaorongruii]|uniref:DsbA family protein n=1 Tax=Gordonia zhaorongruii TaxID=2597659 RepID=UPI0010479227|nr:thioredoxin domain-containing protein [Gordonia zhaorongruii]